MSAGAHPDVPLNVLEPHRLAAFEEAVLEIKAVAIEHGLLAELGGPWSKLALLLESCQRNVLDEVTA